MDHSLITKKKKKSQDGVTFTFTFTGICKSSQMMKGHSGS